MRPDSIVWFERLIFGTLCLGAIQTYLNWQQVLATASTSGTPVAFVFIVQISVFAIITLLTLLTSRRRSKVAMWISVALFALGIPAFIGLVASGLLIGSGWIAALQTLGQLVGYGLLFMPSSRRWMNREDPSAAVS